jgi:prepilin-type N-terminal cleavage/methylation domain-containing protein
MKLRKNDSESGFTLIEVIITLVVVAIVAAMMTSYFVTSITQSSIPISRLQTASKLQQIMELITAQYQVPQWTAVTPYSAGATVLPTTLRRTGLQYKTSSGGTSGTVEPDAATTPTTPWPGAAGGTVAEVSPGSITWTQNGAAPTLINQTWRAGKPYSKNTIIVNGNYQYVTTNGGTSGATQPSWGTTITPVVWTATESTGLTWKYGGPAPTVILQTLIGTAGASGETATDYANVTLGSDTVSYRVIENKFIKFTGNVEVNINANPDDGQYGMYLKVTIGHHSTTPNRTNETLTTLFTVR